MHERPHGIGNSSATEQQPVRAASCFMKFRPPGRYNYNTKDSLIIADFSYLADLEEKVSVGQHLGGYVLIYRCLLSSGVGIQEDVRRRFSSSKEKFPLVSFCTGFN